MGFLNHVISFQKSRFRLVDQCIVSLLDLKNLCNRGRSLLELLGAVSVQFFLLYFVITSWTVDFGLPRIFEMFLMLYSPFDKPTISPHSKGVSSQVFGIFMY